MKDASDVKKEEAKENGADQIEGKGEEEKKDTDDKKEEKKEGETKSLAQSFGISTSEMSSMEGIDGISLVQQTPQEERIVDEDDIDILALAKQIPIYENDSKSFY